jgi:hypothetical protein
MRSRYHASYTPSNILADFAADAILLHMDERLPPLFHDDKESTRRAIHELLAEVDLTRFPIQELYTMTHQLIADWYENQEDLADDCPEKEENGTCIHSDHTP